jgi:alpha-galactosidase
MADESNNPPSIHASPDRTPDQRAAITATEMRPIKVTVLGAGSMFTPRLVNDLLMIDHAPRGELALVDTNADRLTTVQRVIEKCVHARGRPNWTVIASTERTAVMADSDYLINCIEVNGLDCVAMDYDIPARYGIDQCIGDTIGPGGVFKALRTGPAMLDILHEAERLCPDALMLNHTNPMNTLCLAAGRRHSVNTVGLCHSVQATSQKLASEAGVPWEQMHWQCAGINHLAWFTTLTHEGRDLYPRLHEQFHRQIREGIDEAARGKEQSQSDLVRKDMCVQFGAFVTESSGHLSEYVPYYRKSHAGRLLLRPGYDGESRFYANGWPQWRAEEDARRHAMLRGDAPLPENRSWEYTSWLIEAIEKNVPLTIHGNVMNNQGGGEALISNLPTDGCVEVACCVDATGVQPQHFGPLPQAMAALCRSNMAVFDLAATAILERSKEAAIQALMLDPLTAAVCTPGQIREMANQMFEAQSSFLREYQ